MYLTPEAITATLADLKASFPNHILLCDLMNRKFFDRFAGSVHEKIAALGARFTERPEAPEEIFLNGGYRLREAIPTFQRAAELGILRERAGIPRLVSRLLLAVFMRDLNGYRACRFETGNISA